LTQLDVPKLVAGCCGLAAFAVAIVAGLAADNGVDVIVSRALVSLIVCFGMGAIIGMAAESAIREATASIADALTPEESRRDSSTGEAPRKNGAAS